MADVVLSQQPDLTPFASFAASLEPQSALRSAITAHTRAPEPDCVARLVAAATLPAADVEQARRTACVLVEGLRAKGTRGGVEGLVREYDLSSQEGVALMCLAEALLRIPDHATRDALIRDKISTGDWRSHVGHSSSVFVNAATWGLVVTGKLTGPTTDAGLGGALSRLIARGGEPLIRRGVDMAMRMMGEQFVTGQTIAAALLNARPLEARGFQYSYDMLGEAATTMADADRYYGEYEHAIHAIGRASAGRGLYDGPGISVKLSALHPRYSILQHARVMSELLPRLRALTILARHYNIGLNIDAEEADRLELSLDLLEALCLDPALAGWNGIGFVVQAYQKRAPFVLDWIVDLARRSDHRLMIRLVKGAYWDSEIKRAQVDGLADFPVFTRKLHTDVSYLACARQLLAAPDAVFAQFATHNAHTVATIHQMAGDGFAVGRYEFQCLHGMGEPLYEQIVGAGHLNRPCRIYAPVGSHETLLAYLVRRLLENGANSSFVNRIQNPAVPVSELVADPVSQAASSQPVGAPHPRIARPCDLFAPTRRNSAGLDLTDAHRLAELAGRLGGSAATPWRAAPGWSNAATPDDDGDAVRNPADRRDVVGRVREADSDDVDAALAAAASSTWRQTPPTERAACLQRAADLLETRMDRLLGLIVREAGKSFAAAVAELREAVDFLRYYATGVAGFDNATHRALGPVVCISPWNFPLAIFTGQIAAGLASGNSVLAKPAEQTPLIAAQAVAALHDAGVPRDALLLVPGQGAVGARLVGDARVCGVVFTGSTEVARLIQRQLAERLNPDGSPVPLIAETGGLNALIVDSSALAEQVVADVLQSAFDSAGQRCSALRLLCLQDDVADRTLAMLKGALAELSVGNPDRLSTDIGPVISAEAKEGIDAHIQTMRDAGHAVHQAALPAGCADGSFVAPTIIELDDPSQLPREIFGPVLHVLRFPRHRMDAMADAVNATGYGLTFGIHSRIEETIVQICGRSQAGNVYVNRNMIGAVVGVQPFGGHGLSGTGPKAGGPLYLRRLLASCPTATGLPPGKSAAGGWAVLADTGGPSPAGVVQALTGPVGETNLYSTEPRGTVLCIAADRQHLLRQIAAALTTGNRVLVEAGAADWLPPEVSGLVRETPDAVLAPFDAAMFQGDHDSLQAFIRAVAAKDGPIVGVMTAQADGRYPLEAMVRERCVSTNTTAAGGNAQLMMIG